MVQNNMFLALTGGSTMLKDFSVSLFMARTIFMGIRPRSYMVPTRGPLESWGKGVK